MTFFLNAQNSTTRAAYTARIPAELPEPVLIIHDLDLPGRRSVTNAIGEILEELQQQHGITIPKLVIYQDSDGIFDGIDHNAGTFTGYYSLRETDEGRAIAAAIQRAAQAANH